MRGSDEPHQYPVRSFTCHTEHTRADEVQRVIVCIVYTGMECFTCISVSSLVGMYNRLPIDELSGSKHVEDIKN
jgi:hypothetical protein